VVGDAVLAVSIAVVDVDVVEAEDGASKRTHAECYEMCVDAPLSVVLADF